MENTVDSYAQALWSDVLDLATNMEELGASKRAMLEKCEPCSFTGDSISVLAPSRFMKLQIEKLTPLIEKCLEQVAFEPIAFAVEINLNAKPQMKTSSVISQTELQVLSHQDTFNNGLLPQQATQSMTTQNQTDSLQPHYHAGSGGVVQQAVPQVVSQIPSIEQRRAANPLIAEVTENDSKLTFDRFVEGEENMLALQAAKQVADGVKNYNPLFIYGRSGLGKTHLLKAIQNYIIQNKINKLCVYRVSHDFISEYVTAMSDTSAEVKEAFRRNYRDIDILIIDDIQFLKGPGSVGFFFDLFNYLVDHGKQIVLAADKSPAELGLGNQDFDERIISRLDSGFACPIQTPDYDLKLALIKNFYKRAKEDAEREKLMGFEGTISEENLHLMADRAGTNIRVIESFCQSCLLEATKCERAGKTLEREDIIKLATQKFGTSQRVVTIDQILKVVEDAYHVSHSDIVGQTRKKEIMLPRQIACYLAREMTDNTLEQIGKHVGGRKHATIYYSVSETEKAIKESRVLYDRVMQLKDIILND
ncbi:MAG: DnaA/Hda family protein [Atopobium sp.]|uniref:DnaA ATPase domain-containing protein n=1 Tax=Atopobium sp. TaxID=1872650 RepID=UPI002A7FDD4E|nr:DnaA/Hda family protein [Atopobium sp.]MDY4522645.1 DnaA/Hda family protein [Atopobium sp.]